MKCSPHYFDEEGNIKNEERLEVKGVCSTNCIHYEACKKELGMSEDWEFPRWQLSLATEYDIIMKRYFVKNGINVKWTRS